MEADDDGDEKKDFTFDENTVGGVMKTKLLFQSLLDIANREMGELSDRLRDTFEDVMSDSVLWDQSGSPHRHFDGRSCTGFCSAPHR